MQSARVNYPYECEQSLNQTIQLCQAATMTYDHLAAWCASEEVSMPGFCKFFRLCSLRTRKMTEKLINWQTLRGGKYTIHETKPLIHNNDLWQQGIETIVQAAVEVEKKLEHQWRQLSTLSRSKDDIATSELIEDHFLQSQIHVIKMMANHMNGLRVSQNAYLYDRKTMMGFVKQIRSGIHQNFTGHGICQGMKMNNNKSSYNTTISSGISEFCEGILN